MNVTRATTNPVLPRPIPGNHPAPEDWGSDLNERWYDHEVAVVTYAKNGAHMVVKARIGDYNRAGERFQGSFADAVAIARHQASLDDISMPQLGAAAVLRGSKANEWVIAPLRAYGPTDHIQDSGESPTAGMSLPIDPEHGPVSGPEKVWSEGEGFRPGRGFEGPMSDTRKGALQVRAVATDPRLVAIVGPYNWMNFGGDDYAKQLRDAAGK